MVFLVAYFVFLFIAPQLWIPPFVGMRVDLILYPLWLLWVAGSGRLRAFFRFGPQDWFVAGFVAWMTISMAANGFGGNSPLIAITYFKWLVLYRLVAVTLPTLAHVRAAVLLLLAFGIVLGLQSVHQAQDPFGAGWADQGYAWMDDATADAGYSGRTRWINIFDGPGVYCVVFTMTLPLAMHYLWRPFGILTMAWGAGLTALLLLATYYTGSRGGFLATIGVVGLFLLVKLRISIPKMIAVGAIGLTVFMLAPEHLTSTRDSHRSAQRRVAMWAEGMEMIEQNPVFGIGRGNFARYTGRLIAHNSAIEIMGETGVPGTFAWVGMIYMAYKNLFAVRRELQDKVMRSYVDALGLAIAGYLGSAMFVTLEYETFYMLLALAAAAGASLKERPRFTHRDLAILGGAIFAFFIGVKVFVLVYFG
jgi:hypothetical protein